MVLVWFLSGCLREQIPVGFFLCVYCDMISANGMVVVGKQIRGMITMTKPGDSIAASHERPRAHP